MRVMTIVGTRPEIIKLSCVIGELDKYTNHTLVHTGQNYDYELNEVFFRDLQIRVPDYFLNAIGKSTAETIGNIISKSDELFEEKRPEALLLYGDTNSCLSVISAKKRKIPIFHMEAGNRCFDQRVPEEINRKIVDHLSDINMTITEHARRYLIMEGIKPDTVIKVGSSMYEVISKFKNQIEDSSIMDKLNLSNKEFFLVSAHREENIESEKNFLNFLNTLQAISLKYEKKIIVSTHPRTQNKLLKIKYKNENGNIQFLKPLGFLDYIKLQLCAFCVLSDSGTITEEASILDIPAINIREAHERPEGMDQGSLIMSGLVPDDVIEAIEVVTQQKYNGNFRQNLLDDYKISDLSKIVLRIILSYTKFVNRTVWFKGV